MVHETLAYQTFRAAGVPAPRTGYAFVRVNGEPYGVYLNLETYDDVSLKQMFASTGHLYENGFATDLKDDDWKWFEVDEGDEDDRSDLQALTAAAQGSGDFSDRMAGKADLAEMVSMWATEKYVGQWDGYAGVFEDWTPNNYYLHSTTGGLFSMLPWGTDQTWVDRIDFDEGGLLFRQCRQDPSCEALFRQALARVTRTANGTGPARARPGGWRRCWRRTRPRTRARRARRPTSAGGSTRRSSTSTGARRTWPRCWAIRSLDPGRASTRRRCLRLRRRPRRTRRPRPAATPAAARAKLRIGKSAAAGSVVSTRVRVPAGGPVSQRMIMTVRGRNVTACAVGARRLKSGLHTLRCRLSTTARRRLRAGKVRLTVRTRLSGTPLVRTRLTLARCHGC